jgi:hypothetical protein
MGAEGAPQRQAFDHGAGFLGKPGRAQIPTLCGECHADVARMNPYGLRTDQLAAYWTSGHGRALKERGETRVAVCVDCHGSHGILKPSEATSTTHPLNVPKVCAKCHADKALMAEFELPIAVVDEYRHSVHGELLAGGDTGAPHCATCHGNHAAAPPGVASVGAVCGKCHQHAANFFATSVHSQLPEFHGCVQCHGGGPSAHFHLIERITTPPSVLIQRYAHLLHTEPKTAPEAMTEALNPSPRQLVQRVMPTCLGCHDDQETDTSLAKLTQVLDVIAAAQRNYVEAAHELDRVGQGVLLVDNQRFKFEDAKTHLIALAPLQHTLDLGKTSTKVAELDAVCSEVRADLQALESGLRWRRLALVPIWVFAVIFSAMLYAKYKALRAEYVAVPSDRGS